MRRSYPTDKERKAKIERARAYTQRKLKDGIKKILKNNPRVIRYKDIVELHNSLNIKCYD